MQFANRVIGLLPHSPAGQDAKLRTKQTAREISALKSRFLDRGLHCKQKRKFKATTNSNHDLPVADNLLNQTFAPTRPNEAWVTDITYVATDEGWHYLAGIKDVFTCERVGYAMDERMTQTLTAAFALNQCNELMKPAATRDFDISLPFCTVSVHVRYIPLNCYLTFLLV